MNVWYHRGVDYSFCFLDSLADYDTCSKGVWSFILFFSSCNIVLGHFGVDFCFYLYSEKIDFKLCLARKCIK